MARVLPRLSLIFLDENHGEIVQVIPENQQLNEAMLEGLRLLDENVIAGAVDFEYNELESTRVGY